MSKESATTPPSPPTLEELVDFPTEFTFRAVGPNGPGFAPQCEAAVYAALGRPADKVQQQASKGKAWVSVRLTVQLANADQARAVYHLLGKIQGVKMLL